MLDIREPGLGSFFGIAMKVFFNLDGCRPDEEGSIGFFVRAESFICGILRVMGDMEFALPVLGTELGSVRHR